MIVPGYCIIFEGQKRGRKGANISNNLQQKKSGLLKNPGFLRFFTYFTVLIHSIRMRKMGLEPTRH